jgi:Baseplate J-like protein
VTLRLPNLDDRTFTQLVDEARRRIEATCPTWTDLTPHDPGITLIEVFAHLTEVLLYRLNRLPDKAYVAFLNLLGVQQQPPTAAAVVLEFRRDSTGDDPITVPAGTRVSVDGAGKDAPVFTTAATVTLPAGDETVIATVSAHHRVAVDGEVVGEGTGTGGQIFTVSRPPMVRTSEDFDLLVGVQAEPAEIEEGAAAREWLGKTYRLWDPVWSFAGQPPGACVYVVDRTEGRVIFSPAIDSGPIPGVEPAPGPPPPPAPLVAVPGLGRSVAIWYRTGGGPAGNVGAGTLTKLLDSIGGVKVTNPEPARGGRAIEPVENVLLRGPNEFLTVRRAVTAEDFELLAVQSTGGVVRARALTRADLWCYAHPGEVEVVLVPYVPDDAAPGGRVDASVLAEHQTEDALLATQRELDSRKSLGVPPVVVGWAPIKPVSIHARIVVGREEDAARVRERILDRLHRALSPLPGAGREGWGFGQALRRSNVYRLLEQAEPGVQWADRMSFVLDEAPDGVIGPVAADRYQARTWYAGTGETVFRSTNDGDGWEPVGRFPGERAWVIVPYPEALRPGIVAHPGLVAAATRSPDGENSTVYVSEDLGATWRRVGGLDTGITDLAWTSRGAQPDLLIASDKGLFELSLLAGAAPVPLTVDPVDPDRGFYGVEAFVDERGEWAVAVAAQAEEGIYLSTRGGEPGTFTNVGLRGEDTRTLTVQIDGTATWLWAGFGEADPTQPGKGAARARLFETDVRWEMRSTGWTGSTCWTLAFTRDYMVAATQNGGVVRQQLAGATPQWEPLDVNAGLPLRDRARFDPVTTLATPPAGAPIIAGGPKGVHRNSDGAARRWAPCDQREATEVVTIPPTWLLCSGEHQIQVVSRAHARDRAPDEDNGDGDATPAPPAPPRPPATPPQPVPPPPPAAVVGPAPGDVPPGAIPPTEGEPPPAPAEDGGDDDGT